MNKNEDTFLNGQINEEQIAAYLCLFAAFISTKEKHFGYRSPEAGEEIRSDVQFFRYLYENREKLMRMQK